MAAKDLTWVETKKKFPAGSEGKIMKSWIDDLLTSAKVDLTKFFGTDESISSTGKQYIVAVHQSEFDKIKVLLNNDKKAPRLPAAASKKFDIFWTPVKAMTIPLAKELLLLLMNEEKVLIKIKLTVTALSPHSGEKKKKAFKINTAQQELITLAIFKQVLNKDTPAWTTFDKMYADPKSGLKKIHPGLRHEPLEENDWWQSFNAQFEGIPALITKNKLKANHYEVFNRDGTGVTDKQHNFMDYITALITKGPASGSPAAKLGWSPADLAMFAKKDSWNPADIWLIDTVGSKRVYDHVIKDLEKAQSVVEVNVIMQQAYRDKIIKGISLKKNRGTKEQLIFEEVNLIDTHLPKTLPKVKIIEIQFDPHFDWDATKKKGTKVFTSVTSVIVLQEETSKKLYNLAFRSNQSDLKDITYEFKEQGMPSQLGKIPKDRMLATIKDMKLTGVPKKFPAVVDHNSKYDKTHWNAVCPAVGSLLKAYKWTVGDQSKQYKQPWQEYKKTKQDEMRKKLKDPKYTFNDKEEYKKHKAAMTTKNKTASWEAFRENLEISLKAKGRIKGNSIMMQMVDFLYVFAMLKSSMKDDEFILFLTHLFYWAQKKGHEWHFGPFGKMA